MMLRSFIEEKCKAHRWLVHLGVAAGYALAYLAVAGTLSNAPWPFAAGEVVPLSFRSLGHANDFGLAWAPSASIPPILLAMPVKIMGAAGSNCGAIWLAPYKPRSFEYSRSPGAAALRTQQQLHHHRPQARR